MRNTALQIMAALLLASGLALLAWSLFGDRARGQRRCPRCWYDLSGTPGLRCPECGRSASAEKQLFRTRRRWWLVSLSVLLLAGSAAVYAVPIALSANPWSRAPTWLVIWAATESGPLSWRLEEEFRNRVGDFSATNPFGYYRRDLPFAAKPLSTANRRLLRLRAGPALSSTPAHPLSTELISLLPHITRDEDECTRLARPFVESPVFWIRAAALRTLASAPGDATTTVPLLHQRLAELLPPRPWPEAPVVDDDEVMSEICLVVEALGAFGPAARQAVPELIATLMVQAESPKAVWPDTSVCVALGRIGPDAADALPALRIETDNPEDMQYDDGERQVAFQLIAQEAATREEAILNLSHHPQWRPRRAAVGLISDEKPLPGPLKDRLLELLSDPSHYTAISAQEHWLGLGLDRQSCYRAMTTPGNAARAWDQVQVMDRHGLDPTPLFTKLVDEAREARKWNNDAINSNYAKLIADLQRRAGPR